MKHFGLILFQLDEACRHLVDGRHAQLRLALLLLDNAAEIQMEKCIKSHLMWEDMSERLKNQVLQIPAGMRSTDLQVLVEWQPLKRKQKRAVIQYFPEKVRFLSDRVKELDTRLADPLIYLHRYRNEVYHHAKIRKETIETAAKLLLEINCNLLLSLSSGRSSYDSGEDYSWLEERFGKNAVVLMQDEDLVQSTVQRFRTDIDLSDKQVGNLLVNHLGSRIKDVINTLDSIVEDSRIPDRENAIKESYKFGLAQRDPTSSSRQTPEEVETRHSTAFLDQLREKLSEIIGSSNRFEAFHRFAILELQLETVEENVQDLAEEIDHMIQREIDIARGK